MGIDNLKEMRHKLEKIKVGQIMSKFAITTTEEQTVTDLAHLLMRFKISGVPVVGHGDQILGIVTATDLFGIMKKTLEQIDKSAGADDGQPLRVKDIMTPKVFSVEDETSLYDVLKLMCEKNIHTLPVMKEREIVGIIGRRDVINTFYSGQ